MKRKFTTELRVFVLKTLWEHDHSYNIFVNWLMGYPVRYVKQFILIGNFQSFYNFFNLSSKFSIAIMTYKPANEVLWQLFPCLPEITFFLVTVVPSFLSTVHEIREVFFYSSINIVGSFQSKLFCLWFY